MGWGGDQVTVGQNSGWSLPSPLMASAARTWTAAGVRWGLYSAWWEAPAPSFPWPSLAEALILWPPDVKSWYIGKDPDAGKDWGQEEKGAADDEIVRWHHRFSRHDSEQTQGRQGSLACCSPRARKQSDVTSWLKNNNYKISGHLFSMLTQEKVNLKIYVI